MSASKAGLRNQGRARRAQLDPRERREKSRMIRKLLRNLIDGEDPVMVYVSKPTEVETHTLIRELLREGRRVVVPIIERETRTLRLSYLTDLNDLSLSTFSVLEPIGREVPAASEDIAVVIVPMLAFDTQGNRLGYGAGYYDRFLFCCPKAKKIGIAFSCQEVPAVPANADDVGMDYIVTEQGIRNCSVP
jgi:5-formyltetrahydrofolate cyclo-ligase